MVPLLQRVTFLQTPKKVTKKRFAHHSVPRLGSACPHSGTLARVAATGHPWPGAAKSASLPIYPLHRAYLRPSWLTGPADQDQKHAASLALDSCYGWGGSAFLWELACLRCRQLGLPDTPKRCYRRQASSYSGPCPLWLLILLFNTQAGR